MKTIIALLLVIYSALAFGQNKDTTHAASGKKVQVHKVVSGDTWTSIARKYEVTVKSLQGMNKDISMLHPGDFLYIPAVNAKKETPAQVSTQTPEPTPAPLSPPAKATSTSSAKAKTNGGETPAPSDPGKYTYYYVKEKETLYSISKKFDTTVDSLKAWNNLKDDNIREGQRIIVGQYEKLFGKEISKPASGQIPEVKPSNSTNEEAFKVENDTLKGPAREVKEQGIASWIDDEDINPNKYFALHRTAPIGTVIKMTNKMNRKTIFVKVIGNLPSTGDNENLIIKISKASAEKLNVHDQRFQCELSYVVNAQQ